MTLKSNDINNIAHLARLQIEQDDLKQYTTDLTNILHLVEQMKKTNTDDVEPMAHPLETAQRLRIDEANEPNQRDKFQQFAPDVESGLYRVPRVIE